MVERVTLGEAEESPADAPQEPQENLETTAEETTQPEEGNPVERPEWLPNKFESSEELAKAYGQLEKKFSSKQAEEQGLLTTEDFQQYSEEYSKEGGLADKTYEDLAKRGLSRELVDNYIKGQETLQAQVVQDMYGIAGGEENYKAMIDWAAENLDQEELDAFNTAVQGDVGATKLAIRGLHSQFSAATGGGSTPALIQGGKPTQVGGYGSTYEMTEDMKDPRYKAGDVKFHAYVEKRIAATSGDIL